MDQHPNEAFCHSYSDRIVKLFRGCFLTVFIYVIYYFSVNSSVFLVMWLPSTMQLCRGDRYPIWFSSFPCCVDELATFGA